MTFLLPLYGAILPFLVWPLELLFPYPHFVEEIAKAGLVWFLVKSELSGQKKVGVAAVIGGVFGFSESNLYLFNVFMAGGLRNYLMRLLVVVPMHILTSVVIVLPALKRRWFIGFGLLGAILIHSVFNLYISGI